MKLFSISMSLLRLILLASDGNGPQSYSFETLIALLTHHNVAAVCHDYLSGTAPICKGVSTDCRAGYHYGGDVDGGCFIGHKVRCVCNDPNCLPCQDYLEGTGPFCSGGNSKCRNGWKKIGTVTTGCLLGSKTYCQCVGPCIR